MDFPVQETLEKFGVRRVAAASGIPFWTLRKWYDANKVPGEGTAREMRVKALRDAIAKMEPIPEDMRRERKSRKPASRRRPKAA